MSVKSKKKRRSPRRVVHPIHQINNSSHYVESTILKIWCKKHNFDDEFYEALTKNEITGLSRLQTLNRLKLRQLIKNLDWESFQRPENEEQLCGLLDKVDRDSPMNGRYYGGDSDSDEDEYEQKATLGLEQGCGGIIRSEMAHARPKMAMKKRAKCKMKSARSSAMAPRGATMSTSAKLDFDDDDMNLGFAVGGANDVQLFRDQIENNKMPRQTDITFEGIYNEYYFDTDTKQKGKEMEDEEPENETEETEEDHKENESETEEDKPMFYPSYCYAKSHRPYALCVTETIKPKIIKTTKKKKSPKKEEEGKTAAPTSEMDDVWKKYVKQFGYAPGSSNSFFKYASDKGAKGISYKTAANYYNTHKPQKKSTLPPRVVASKPKTEEETYHFNDIFEDDPDDITFDVPDEKMKEREIFMTVGLNSNIKQRDFERKKLNLVVLLDISGSMNKPFQQKETDNYWGYNTKMQIASKAVLGLLTNLNHEDKFGLVTFNRSAQVHSNIVPMNKIRVSFLRRITNIYANGGTNFEQGYLKCIELLKGVEKNDAYDNRIMILTDLRPNMGQKDPQKLMKLVTKHAEDDVLTIFTTFIGIGLDFNSKLVSKLGKIKGANYYSVHSNKEFMKTMEKEFIYMVSPLVFNLKLTLKSEGDVAYIDKVYGSNSDDLKSGEIMNIKSLFPSPPNESGETKGGIVLLRIKQKDNTEMDQSIFSMIVEVSFEDKYGKTYTNKQTVEFGGDNNLNTDDYYDNNGVQKGILLARFVELMHEWVLHDRYYYINNMKNVAVTKKHYWYSLRNRKNKKEQNIYISSKYKKIFRSFETYFKEQSAAIKDGELKREQDIVHKLCCYSDDD